MCTDSNKTIVCNVLCYVSYIEQELVKIWRMILMNNGANVCHVQLQSSASECSLISLSFSLHVVSVNVKI